MWSIRRDYTIIRPIKIIRILVLTLAVISPEAALADWKIYYTGQMGNMFGSGGRGSFATRAECEAYRSSSPSSERNNSYCSGFDNYVYRPPPQSRPHGDDGAAAREQEKERQLQLQREREAARQKKFAEGRDKLLGTLKGTSKGSLGLKDGAGPVSGLGLKGGDSGPGAGGASSREKDLQKVQERIADLQRQVSGIQTLLRGYSRTLHGNSSEFEKWAQTVDQAYNSVLDNSKEYIANMFIQYNLLGALERRMQKSAFAELGAFVGSDHPAIQAWLAKELGRKQIQLNRLSGVIDRVSLSGDAASLLTGGQEETGRNLDALLFANGLLETKGIVKYERILKESGLIKGLPGGYFEQAKMIGETYADLASIGYSWFSINRLTKNNEHYAREISSLSHRMKVTVSEIGCLRGCLETYADKCMDRCAGKTRFSTPPPLLN